jgi:hypothetical protein
MKTVYKDLWIAALESGDYEQSRGTLKNKTGYCCLGVLCEVAQMRGEELHNDSRDVLDYKTLRFFGLSESEQDMLVNMNDGLGDWNNNRQSFKAIAEQIRSI